MNFALILLILSVVTGIAWIADKLVFAPQRKAAGIDRMPFVVGVHGQLFPCDFCGFLSALILV